MGYPSSSHFPNAHTPVFLSFQKSKIYHQSIRRMNRWAQRASEPGCIKECNENNVFVSQDQTPKRRKGRKRDQHTHTWAERLLTVASCCFLLLPVASCWLLLLTVASCCSLLLPIACCCLLLLAVASCCFLLLPVACCCSLLLSLIHI